MSTLTQFLYKPGVPMVAAGGTVDAITAAYAPAITLVNQLVVGVVLAGANTVTTPSFSPNGLTARTIVKNGGVALGIGDLPRSLAVALLQYDLANTRWELLNPGISSLNASLNIVQTFTKTQSVTPVALTSSGASIATDLSLSNNFSHTLTENTTLANPTNIVAGTSGQIAFTQDASSAKTLAYGSYWDFTGGTTPSLTTTASARDTLVWYARSTTLIEAVLLKGWA